MGYPKILVLGPGVFELTIRCAGSKFLFTPHPRLVVLLLGVIGRAQAKYEVVIYTYAILPNHIHIIVRFETALQGAAFKRFLFGCISKEVKRFYNTSEVVFDRRCRQIPCVDSESELARLKYVLSNSCKEGLVRSPLEYPGPHSARAMVSGQPDIGIWVNWTWLNRKNRSKQKVPVSAAEIRYPVTLSPIPAWENLPEHEQRAKARALITEIEREALEAREGKPFLGAEKLLRQDPFSRPKKTSRKRAPLCHGTAESKVSYLNAYRKCCETYAASIQWLKDTGVFHGIPAGMLLPGALQLAA